MRRIIKKPGDIFKFPLTAEGVHAYAQWLPDATVRVFLAACDFDLSVDQVLRLPTAFRVLLFKDTPNRYEWLKVGPSVVPEHYSAPMRYAKKDILTGALSVYFQGIETSASQEQLKDLETLAVWAHPHIVERLEAQLEGRESKFLKSISVTV
jgi:hypothetical protein